MIKKIWNTNIWNGIPTFLRNFKQTCSYGANSRKEIKGGHKKHGHKKQIVWEHGPNWPFYALILEAIRLCNAPFEQSIYCLS